MRYRKGQGFNLVLRKYSPSGGLVWARQFDGAAHGSDHGAGVAVGADGSVLFTGSTWVEGQGHDLLLRKYSAAGDFLWARTYGGAPNEDDGGRGVAIAPDGSVNPTGHTSTQGGHPVLLLQKYSAGGDHLWTRTWNGVTNGADRGESVAVGRDGSVYVTGVTDEWVMKALGGGNALLLQRYSPAGTLLWTRTMKRGDWNEAHGAAVDDSGTVYVTGSYEGRAAPNPVLFLRKYTASGRVLWTRATTGSTSGISATAELRRFAEPLITLAKSDSVANRRLAFSRTRSKEAVGKLFSELGPRYKDPPGGYIRILKCGFRPGDSAPMAFVELVDRPRKAAASDDE